MAWHDAGSALDVSGQFVITGGLGGLGLRAASLLADHGATGVVLASRSGHVAREVQGSTQQQQLGTAALVVGCDSADAVDVTAFRQIGVQVNGVLHAAGLGDKGFMSDLDSRRVAWLMAPKARGAWLLHVGLLSLALDVWVVYASVGGGLGNVGQSNYALANACLDAHALSHRALGVAGRSLQWPLISDAGMGAATQAALAKQGVHRVGMASISLEQHAACLGIHLTCPICLPSTVQLCHHPRVAEVLEDVADASETRFSELTSLYAMRNRHIASCGEQSVDGALANGVAGLAPFERQAHVEASVLRTVHELTGAAAADVDVETPLMEAGVDSLAATELASRLRVLTGITLSPTLVFEHPTPRAIAAHLLEQVGGGAGGVVSPVCIVADATAALALVGAAGRWPGGCNDDASRWHLASACGNGVSSVPSVRWTLELVVDTSTLSAVQAACVRHGGFLAGAELFAHAAFGVSRAEASVMDPQQRLLLESGYASLHCSGARRSLLMGGDGGVFLGIERPDWAIAMPGPSRASVYAVTGDNVSVAAGRLSFVLGMQGPCSSIDTACSSGVAALHGAGHAVRAGECSRAVTLAVSLKLMPYGSLGCASAGMLSVDGRCKTFDARANGYARSEGLSSVAILRDVAECVVLLASSAVRQDGRSASLTAPNGSAQRTLLMAALGRASRDAAEVSTIEAHGTGTPLGDPTEAGALSAVHSSVDRPSPLCISSAKANVGHAEAPSGLVGLLKARLHLLDAACFANAHLREPNPLVIERLGGLGESVCTFLLPQHAIAGSRLTRTCGLSSFGFSGTISHCLLAASTLVAAWCSSSPVRFVRSLFAWHGSGNTDGTTLAAVGMYALCWSATSLPVASRTTAAEGLVLGRHGVLMAGAGHASASWRIVVVLMDAAAQAAPSMLGSELVLHLGQLLSREVHRARLVVVTCGTQAASMVMSSSSAAHGGVWGLLRVLRLEHASLRPLSVDAAAGCVAGTAEASGLVLADAAGAEAELASSGAACWHAARLRRGLADEGSALDVSGQFVITGGLGGLGLRAASLLADHGATGVVLASRSGHVAREVQGSFFSSPRCVPL